MCLCLGDGVGWEGQYCSPAETTATSICKWMVALVGAYGRRFECLLTRGERVGAKRLVIRGGQKDKMD